MNAFSRLAELGIELPPVVKPAGAYVPAVRTGNLVYTAGQVPIQSGTLSRTGKVGAEVSEDDAKLLARMPAPQSEWPSCPRTRLLRLSCSSKSPERLGYPNWLG